LANTIADHLPERAWRAGRHGKPCKALQLLVVATQGRKRPCENGTIRWHSLPPDMMARFGRALQQAARNAYVEDVLDRCEARIKPSHYFRARTALFQAHAGKQAFYSHEACVMHAVRLF
jgi:hypothetical protein